MNTFYAEIASTVVKEARRRSMDIVVQVSPVDFTEPLGEIDFEASVWLKKATKDTILPNLLRVRIYDITADGIWNVQLGFYPADGVKLGDLEHYSAHAADEVEMLALVAKIQNDITNFLLLNEMPNQATMAPVTDTTAAPVAMEADHSEASQALPEGTPEPATSTSGGDGTPSSTPPVATNDPAPAEPVEEAAPVVAPAEEEVPAQPMQESE
jgi:hypothetical protein